MTALVERPIRRASGRILLAGTLVMAVVGAVALVLGADDVRLLRLGIVAALWAALLGAFAAVRMRRDFRSAQDRAEELRTVYQLELEREIAARREHELAVERDVRAQVERAGREEIAALRTELAALRENLQHLMGGDLMVERVALRAESTRLRPLADQLTDLDSRVLPAAAADAGVVTTDWSAYLSAPPRGREPVVEPAGAAQVLVESIPTVPRAARRGGSDHQWAPAVSAAPDHKWAPAVGAARHSWSVEPSRPPFGPNADSGRRHTNGNGNGRVTATALGGDGSSHPGATAFRHAVPPAPRSGAHSGGLPVQDLLAAYGSAAGPRHRRRADG
jgi:hypothetical protein